MHGVVKPITYQLTQNKENEAMGVEERRDLGS